MTNKPTIWLRVLLLTATAGISLAQTFTTIKYFNGTDGQSPLYGSLAQGLDGSFYGATAWGGTDGSCHQAPNLNGCGTVFKITAAGALTSLHSFQTTDGSHPYGGLVLATDGNFYATTNQGGANGLGTIFQITPAGVLTTLHNFAGTADGANPYASLVQGAEGNLYGVAYTGGANGFGTVFKMTLGGAFTTLHNFNLTDGSFPTGPLIQANDNVFYGTTFGGGNSACLSGLVAYCGTIFKITSAGLLTTLFEFDGGTTDGSAPFAGLVQAANGDFYGTTYGEQGIGGHNFCVVYKVTSAGVFTRLHTFNGTFCRAGLTQGTDGNLYGVAGSAIYSVTPAGSVTVLYEGARNAFATPIQGANGSFYGTTDSGPGMIYSLSVGLGPFVETVPVAGTVGTTVSILGTNLTGATSVSFNGTAATFTVNSTGSAVSTTVPAGATTGTIQVVTPGSTLSSNVPFRVLP